MASDKDKMLNNLRTRAEKLLFKTGEGAEELTLEEVRTLVHDLRVHQVELELQNEELRRTQKELQTATDNFSKLFNHAPAGYISVSKNGSIIQVNQTFGEMIGRESSRLIRTSFFDLVYEDDKSELIARFRAFRKNPKDKNIQIRIKNGKNSFFHANLEGRLQGVADEKDNNKDSGYLLIIVTDTTLRQEAEEALRQSAHLNELLMDNFPHPAMIIGRNRRILVSNRRAREVGATVGGYCWRDFMQANYISDNDKELLVKNPGVIPANGVMCRFCQANEALATQKNRNNPHLELLGADWDTWWVPVDSETFLHFAIDISDRIRAEKEKARLQAQLEQAQKMEAIGTLAGGIAHDFNNLLQAMLGYTQLVLMEKKQDHPDFKNLTAIMKAGNRAADLVRQMLLFSRKVEADRKPLDLSLEIEQAVTILRRTIPKMIEIDIIPGQRLWKVMADPIQFEQILLNLGSNASDAMPNGGRFTIEGRNIVIDEKCAIRLIGAPPGKYVRLRISDSGCGMDSDIVQHIFEPFFTTKDIGKGTGLGLASVYGIVKNHGGSIQCHSEVGQGTVFSIYLPAIDAAATSSGDKYSESDLVGGSETIMVVDDESGIREFAGQLLRRVGYNVLEASRGEEAVEKYCAKTGPIDLVLLDIDMPGIGGHQALEEILREDPSAVVLISSGYPYEGQVLKTVQSGAAGYVGKPYQMHDLLRNVRTILDANREDKAHY